jgi:hypothetical protein
MNSKAYTKNSIFPVKAENRTTLLFTESEAILRNELLREKLTSTQTALYLY